MSRDDTRWVLFEAMKGKDCLMKAFFFDRDYIGFSVTINDKTRRYDKKKFNQQHLFDLCKKGDIDLSSCKIKVYDKNIDKFQKGKTESP